MSFKQFGLYSAFFILLISLVANYGQYKLGSTKDERIGTLTSELSEAMVSNENLSSQVELLEQERIDAQTLSDELARVRAERKHELVETVTVIKEVLIHEECADRLVPYPDDGLHYY